MYVACKFAGCRALPSYIRTASLPFASTAVFAGGCNRCGIVSAKEQLLGSVLTAAAVCCVSAVVAVGSRCHTAQAVWWVM